MDWFNGTLARLGRDDVRGHIAAHVDVPPPHESAIEKAMKEGAVAFLAIRVSRNAKIPGSGMFFVDGSDRTRLTIPCFEIIVQPETHPIILLPFGSPISIHPQTNQFLTVAQTKFQLIFNLILSFFELAIVAVGLYRLYQFWIYGNGKVYLGIGPTCIIFEMLGALLRLAYTIVDPFYSYRMIPDRVHIVMITISFPFTLSAGILLTFFWAEALSRSSIQAKPFISAFKIPAIVVVVCLFIIEIVCSALRVTLQNRVAFSPNYVSTFVYFVITIILIVCYIWTAVAVALRLAKMDQIKARRSIVNMTIRVSISSIGYITFAICMILFLFVASKPWGLTLVLNGAFLGENFAAIMQVIALRPVITRISSSSNPTARRTNEKNSFNISNGSHSHHSMTATSPINDYIDEEAAEKIENDDTEELLKHEETTEAETKESSQQSSSTSESDS